MSSGTPTPIRPGASEGFQRFPLPWVAIAGVFVILLLAGCRSIPEIPSFDLSERGWEQRHGQAVWRPTRDKAEIAGELFVARHPDGRGMVEFSKSPLPLVVARWDLHYWRVKFVPRDKVYGSVQPAPDRLIWPHLAGSFNGEKLPASWRFQRVPGGGWRLANEKTGERLEGYIEPGLPGQHVARSGDTIANLATRYGVPAGDVMKANTNLDVEDKNAPLKPGSVVAIPTP